MIPNLMGVYPYLLAGFVLLRLWRRISRGISCAIIVTRLPDKTDIRGAWQR